MLNHTQYRFQNYLRPTFSSNWCSSNKYSDVLEQYRVYRETNSKIFTRLLRWMDMLRNITSKSHTCQHFLRIFSHPIRICFFHRHRNRVPPLPSFLGQFRVARHSALQLDRITGERREEMDKKVRWKKKRAGVVSAGSADPRSLSPQLTARASNMADKTGSPREGLSWLLPCTQAKARCLMSLLVTIPLYVTRPGIEIKVRLH